MIRNVYLLILLSVFSLKAQQNEGVIEKKEHGVSNAEKKDLEVYKEFYDSGTLKRSGFKKNGKLEGLFLHYDERGKLIYHVMYKQNKILYTRYLGHKNGLVIRKIDSVD